MITDTKCGNGLPFNSTNFPVLDDSMDFSRNVLEKTHKIFHHQIEGNRFLSGNEDGWVFTWNKDTQASIAIEIGNLYGLHKASLNGTEFDTASIVVLKEEGAQEEPLSKFTKEVALEYLRTVVKKTAMIAVETQFSGLQKIVIKANVQDSVSRTCALTYYGPNERFTFQQQAQQTIIPSMVGVSIEKGDAQKILLDIAGEYSSLSKEFYGAIPSNLYSCQHSFVQDTFEMSRLPQTSITEIMEQRGDKKGISSITNVSLADVLSPIQKSIGIIRSEGEQVGSCTLISADLAILACHSIEDLPISHLEAQFDFVFEEGMSVRTYRVKKVVEYDPSLDFAIVQFEEDPGSVYSYLRVQRGVEPISEPALLHCPLNKSLQVSIHACDSGSNLADLFTMFHDSDYGSSGGAYVDPLRVLIAIHLGSEYNLNNCNLRRVALPMELIMQTYPDGILSCLADGRLSQNHLYDSSEIETVNVLPFYARNFIDFEKFDESKFSRDSNTYLLRPIQEGRPGLIIDSRQAKHTTQWPGGKLGGGSTFRMSMDETIELAEVVAANISLFSTIPDERNRVACTPNKQIWIVDKKSLGKELFKKLKQGRIERVDVHSAFENGAWAFHMFPIPN